jgi:hypothetical protein
VRWLYRNVWCLSRRHWGNQSRRLHRWPRVNECSLFSYFSKCWMFKVLGPTLSKCWQVVKNLTKIFFIKSIDNLVIM